MKNTKKILAIIVMVAIIGGSMIACGEDTPQPHKHTYSLEWSANTTQHWKECTKKSCDAKTDIADHAPADGICGTCEYNNTPAHVHTYSKIWSSNATQHWKECTGPDCDDKTDITNHLPADGICEECGDNNTPGHTHTYSEIWTSNATQHWKECTGADCEAHTDIATHSLTDGICVECGYISHIHTFSEIWSSDATQHWKECTDIDCDGETGRANHSPPDGVCGTCGDDNTPGHEHTYSSEWSFDETQHWKECTGANCEAHTELGNHSPADGICEECEYDNTPVHIHTYSEEWSSDAAQHWKECIDADCDVETARANHSPADGVCGTCGDDNTPGHEHAYNGWSYNAAQHWKKCTGADCEAHIELAAHSMAIGICTDCDYSMVVNGMSHIPAGHFTFGSATITLSAFKMSIYEVTQEQYLEVMGTNPSYFTSGVTSGETQVKRPVERLRWFDAIEFCNKLSEKENLTPVYTITGRTPETGYPITAATVTANWENNGYRLPTEAQWEYACRAGTTTTWDFGNDENLLVNYAWYTENANGMTHQVGIKTANAWGLHDMYGNVFEWCWDWWGNLPTSNQTDYKGPATGTSRVMRGGSYTYGAENARSAYRSANSSSLAQLGFRVVLP